MGTLKTQVAPDVWVPIPSVGAIPGEIKIYAGATPPPGYELCDGRAVPRPISAGGTEDTYIGVWGAIGTTWGAGNGTSTFNLPDLVLRVPVGAGSGRALGSTDNLAVGNRAVKWSHAHAHNATATSTTTISGGINSATTGVYNTATDTNHNHPGPPDHGTGTNASGTNNTRLGPGPGHGSTGTAAQANGQVHNHGTGDPGHAHGHTISASTSTSASVSSTDSGDHPTAAVNYIIKI